MNEDALRALVRDTIARLESSRAERAGAAPGGESWATPQQLDESRLLHFIPHPSQYQYALPPTDGPCLIEPGVPCNHCGYCQAHGF